MSNAELLQLVKDYTEGKARQQVEFYIVSTPDPTFEGLINNIRTSFQSGEDEAMVKGEFYSRKQFSKESVDDFEDVLQLLACKVLNVDPSFQTFMNKSLCQQGSLPSENTNESTQPTQPNKSNQPKRNTTGYSKKNPKSKSQYLGGYVEKVMVGSRHQPICIPAGSCKFLVGTAKGVSHKGNFMMEGTQDGNLPSGVAVNNTYVQPTKSGCITVCLQNTNDHNVWIRQPLYAGDLWDMDKEDWEYEPVLVKDAETNNITVKFQQVPPEHLREEIFSQAAEMFGPDKTDKEGETKTKEKEKESDPQKTPKDSADQQPPKFGPRPDTSSADFDFKTELDRLPFTINIGEAPLSREQQSRFIDLIYDYKEVFSLYDGDLGFCDALKHYTYHHRQAHILASSTDSCPVTTRGKKMPRIMAKTGHNPAIKESLRISGCNCPQKVQRNPTLRRLPEVKCNFNQRLFSAS